MENPLLSFIIPVYNREREISKAVQSVLSSGFESFEIILVNDASKDRSGQVCEELSSLDQRIQTIHHEHNMGPGPARNHGMKIAKGQFLYFLDSDDVIHGQALLEVAEVLQRNPEIDVLTMNHKIITPKGENEIALLTREQKLPANQLLEEKPFLLHTELWRHIFNACFVRTYHITVPNIWIGEDTCFSSLAFLQATTVYVWPKVFCIHRTFSDNSLVEHTSWQKYVDGFEYCAYTISDYCSKHVITSAVQSAIDAYIYSCVIPLLKHIPLKQLEDGIQRMKLLEEPSNFQINLALYSKYGMLGCALYIWHAMLNQAISKVADLYICPAGSVSAEIAKKLLQSGIQVKGFLDNHCSQKNFYVADTKNIFMENVYSFDIIQEYLTNNKDIFIIVLGSSSTAKEIAEQLQGMGLEKEKQFICGL